MTRSPKGGLEGGEAQGIQPERPAIDEFMAMPERWGRGRGPVRDSDEQRTTEKDNVSMAILSHGEGVGRRRGVAQRSCTR